MIKKWLAKVFDMSSGKNEDLNENQRKAQLLSRKYLDNLNKQSKYDILEYSDFRSVMTDYGDDPVIASYNDEALIPNELKKNFKPQIKGWVITVVYNGKNETGKNGKHKYLLAFNSDLSKLITGIETTSVNIHI